MTLRASTVLADAKAAWRADWTVLLSVAGALLFLPQLAVLLLVPALPDFSHVTSTDPNDPAFQAAMQALSEWLTTFGVWPFAVLLLGLFAQFAIVAWYVTPGQPSVGRALTTGARLFPRFLLASIAWGLPLGLLNLVLLQAPFLILPVVALVTARTLLVGAAILAEPPIGALAAIGRSFRATRGHMLMLASVILTVMLAQYLLAMPLVAADKWMLANGPNPVARTIVDSFEAGVAMLGAIAMALIQAAVWRRLA